MNWSALRHQRRVFPARLIVAVAAVAGLATLDSCADDPARPQPHLEDTSRIVLAMSQSGFDADALFPTGEFAIADAGRPEPVAFRRVVERIDEVREYTFSEPDAYGVPSAVTVMICKYQKGTYQLVRQYAPQDPTPADSSDRVHDKIVNSDWFRLVRLQRAPGTTFGWTVTASSEAYLVVDNKRLCCQAQITQVRLRQGANEIVMPVDPSLSLDDLVVLPTTDPVTVIVTTTNDDDVVLVHDATGSRRLGLAGATTYEGPLAFSDPWQQFTVEALTDSSLSDTTVRVSQHGYTIYVHRGPIAVP